MLKLVFIPISLLLLMVPLAEADIVFNSDRDGVPNIYVMNDDGSDVRKVTDNTPFAPGGPIWSPDGTQIAYDADLHWADPDKHQQLDVFLMKADGTRHQNLTEHPAIDVVEDWAPDGKHLLFTSNRSGNIAIYVMEIASRKVWQLTNDPGDNFAAAPAWSPDGKKIAYEYSKGAQGRYIYIMTADGRNPRPLLRKPRRGVFGGIIISGSPAWSPDGEHIVYAEMEYIAGRGRVANAVIIVNVHTRHLKVLDIPARWRIDAVCWMDGGSAVLFDAVPDGLADLGQRDFNIFRYRLGTGQLTNLTEHPSDNWGMDWTPHHSLSVAAVDKLATQWGHLKAGKAANVKPPF